MKSTGIRDLACVRTSAIRERGKVSVDTLVVAGERACMRKRSGKHARLCDSSVDS
jgi:hypothetical protein